MEWGRGGNNLPHGNHSQSKANSRNIRWAAVEFLDMLDELFVLRIEPHRGWFCHRNSEQYTLLTCVTQASILPLLPEDTLVWATTSAPIGLRTEPTILLGAGFAASRERQLGHARQSCNLVPDNMHREMQMARVKQRPYA